MIQRIQTVYLFLVLVLTLLFMYFPVGSLQPGDTKFMIKIWEINPTGYQEYGIPKGYFGYTGLIIAIAIMALSIYTTLQFKRRLHQIKLGKTNILLNVMLVVLTFFYLDDLKTGFEQYFSYQAGVIFPLLSMVFILMANRAIRKDEDRVGAASRLR